MRRILQNKSKVLKYRSHINLILIVTLVSYSIIIPLLLPSIYIGISQTVSSTRFPNSFIEKDFNSTDPWIEVSFLVKNYNRLDLNLELTISIYVQYYSEDSHNMEEITFFQSLSVFPSIAYDRTYPKVINFTSSYFSLPILTTFHTSVNLSRPCTFLMNAHFFGYYLGDLMSFRINFTALNISEYEFII
jgi:hypothetical protein